MLIYWISVKYFLSPLKVYIGGLREIVFLMNDMNNFTACVQTIHAFLEIIRKLKT